VGLSYLSVVLIWSTTPLAIKWSAEEAGFAFALFSRMAIGVVLAVSLMVLLRQKLSFRAEALKVYLAAAFSIYGSMQLVYWGALYIPSGLIAVIFGFAPMLTSVIANRWLAEKQTDNLQWLAMFISLCGLVIIFMDDFQNQFFAMKGILAVVLAVILHSGSAVMIKSMQVEISAMSITTGGLLVSLPLFALTWYLSGASLPLDMSMKAGISILYLGSMGSVVGFVLYYYVLGVLTASTVALITLITPVTALMLGVVFNDEVITAHLAAGTMLVMFGLMIYQWGSIVFRRFN